MTIHTTSPLYNLPAKRTLARQMGYYWYHEPAYLAPSRRVLANAMGLDPQPGYTVGTVGRAMQGVNLSLSHYAPANVSFDNGTIGWTGPLWTIPTSYRVEKRESSFGQWITLIAEQGEVRPTIVDGRAVAGGRMSFTDTVYRNTIYTEYRLTPVTLVGDAQSVIIRIPTEVEPIYSGTYVGVPFVIEYSVDYVGTYQQVFAKEFDADVYHVNWEAWTADYAATWKADYERDWDASYARDFSGRWKRDGFAVFYSKEYIGVFPKVYEADYEGREYAGDYVADYGGYERTWIGKYIVSWKSGFTQDWIGSYGGEYHRVWQRDDFYAGLAVYAGAYTGSTFTREDISWLAEYGGDVGYRGVSIYAGEFSGEPVGYDQVYETFQIRNELIGTGDIYTKFQAFSSPVVYAGVYQTEIEFSTEYQGETEFAAEGATWISGTTSLARYAGELVYAGGEAGAFRLTSDYIGNYTSWTRRTVGYQSDTDRRTYIGPAASWAAEFAGEATIPAIYNLTTAWVGGGEGTWRGLYTTVWTTQEEWGERPYHVAGVASIEIGIIVLTGQTGTEVLPGGGFFSYTVQWWMVEITIIDEEGNSHFIVLESNAFLVGRPLTQYQIDFVEGLLGRPIAGDRNSSYQQLLGLIQAFLTDNQWIGPAIVDRHYTTSYVGEYIGEADERFVGTERFAGVRTVDRTYRASFRQNYTARLGELITYTVSYRGTQEFRGRYISSELFVGGGDASTVDVLYDKEWTDFAEYASEEAAYAASDEYSRGWAATESYVGGFSGFGTYTGVLQFGAEGETTVEYSGSIAYVREWLAEAEYVSEFGGTARYAAAADYAGAYMETAIWEGGVEAYEGNYTGLTAFAS